MRYLVLLLLINSLNLFSQDNSSGLSGSISNIKPSDHETICYETRIGIFEGEKYYTSQGKNGNNYVILDLDGNDVTSEATQVPSYLCDLDCCTFTINSNRNGITNSNFFNSFEFGDIVAADWTSFINQYQNQGGTVNSTCPDGSCNVTTFRLCGYNPDDQITYEDQNGDRQTIETTCNKKGSTDCKRYIPIYYLFDNSGTNASNENTFLLEFADGSNATIVQPPQVNGAPGGSKWTNQFLVLQQLITDEYSKKCGAFQAEIRFNPRINGNFSSTDLSNYTPPDGLLVPPEELWGAVPNMQYRYMQINSCSTCSNASLINVKLVSVNGEAIDFDMTSVFKVGKEVRYDICQQCSDEGIDRMYWYQQSDIMVPEAELPVCLLECNESTPSPPSSGCRFTTETVCDSRGTETFDDDVVITKRYQDCGDGTLSVAYLIDEDGGSVLYDDLIDESHVILCGTDEAPSDPPIEITDPFSTVCKKACSKGVSIDVVIGYNANGNVLWYRDEQGNEIKPDFDSECPEKECTTESLNICANGDYKGIEDGDEFLGVFQSCNDGSQELLSMASFDDLSSSVDIPEDFSFTFCAGSELEFTGCFIDEKGVRWNAFIVNGTDQAYQNIETGAFGTPSGSLEPCEETQTIVDAIDDKHCIRVGEQEYRAFLILNADGSLSAKALNGALYQEGEYSLISCCPETDVRTSHFEGFTVTRPTDTPNNGWNNEFTTSSTAITGDFRLCFTPSNSTGNTPNMIGINSDPTTNASYTSIDCALYLRDLNGQQNLYHYENGAYQGFMGTQNWDGQEICFVRSGGTLTFEFNGTPLTYTNGILADCNIGTGTVFLDDSHYFANGTWGTGSITYSDFELVQLATDDNIIKSVSECCCSSGGTSDGAITSITQSGNTITFTGSGSAASGTFTFTDTNTTYSETIEARGYIYAEARGYNNAVEYQRDVTVTALGTGLFQAIFTNAHPLGNRYTVTWGAEEDGNRDVPKQMIVRGTQTATGFQFYNTVDDNGTAADTPNLDSGWHFHVSSVGNFVTDIVEN